jgi:hypothetical protein
MREAPMQKIFLIVFVCLLAACAPSPEAIETAIAETQAAANPTATFTTIDFQTFTPSPIPTQTATITATATITLTSTPAPATETAAAITAIKSAANAQASATALFINSQATEIAKYIIPETKRLITYPENFKDKFIRVKGRVFNINNGEGYQPWFDGRTQEFQLWLDGSSEPAYIVMLDPFTGIFENDWVIVYGIGSGKKCVDNAAGEEICQPLIVGELYEHYKSR